MADDLKRITGATLDVMAALLAAENMEAHGWALMRATGQGGPTVYRNLERFERAGLVSARWEESAEPGKPRRRLYQLTPIGVARARALLAERRPQGVLRPALGS